MVLFLSAGEHRAAHVPAGRRRTTTGSEPRGDIAGLLGDRSRGDSRDRCVGLCVCVFVCVWVCVCVVVCVGVCVCG